MLVVAATTVFVAAACTGAGPATTAPARVATTTTTPAPTTISTAPTSTSTTVVSTTSTSPRLVAERFPTEYSPDWETWAVFVIVRPFDEYSDEDARGMFDGVRARAASLGYDPGRMGGFDLGCSPGTAEALGFDADESYMAEALFFDTEAAARAVAEAFRPYTIGYGFFLIGCAD